MEQKDKTAKAIVEPLLYKHLSTNKKNLLPKIENWCRSVNKFREDSRPSNPKNLDFDLVKKAIPKNFNHFNIDVDNGKARHLLFFSDAQLKLLKTTKRWYLDGTFSIVKVPFMQLWTIHGMMRSGTQHKQVPLAYVLMSRRQRVDYEKVLQLLFNEILKKKARVVEFVCDFEKAVWQSVRLVFGENVNIFGCGFHWTQCLFRQLKKIGLTSYYRDDKTVSILCKQVMSLHLLPKAKIKLNFERLSETLCDISNRDARKLLKKWFSYVSKTWFNSSTWPISSWCQHHRKIRTNNDVEGWHTRLNVHCGNRRRNGLPLYLLIDVLFKESQISEMYKEMLLQGHKLRRERKTYTALNEKLFKLWEDHRKNVISSESLLLSCAKLYSDFNLKKIKPHPDDDRCCELED